jgi:uncharacterized membrane protein YfcA
VGIWELFVVFIRSQWGVVLLDAFALLFFLVGVYFLAQLLQARRRWKRIQHESPRGPVEISLFAIRLIGVLVGCCGSGLG